MITVNALRFQYPEISEPLLSVSEQRNGWQMSSNPKGKGKGKGNGFPVW
jgi:hypothetical protein